MKRHSTPDERRRNFERVALRDRIEAASGLLHPATTARSGMSSDSPLPAALQQPLQLLADEYSQEVPPEVYRVFPEWRTELQSI